MNRDFVEMLAALSAAGADFLVVGAYALAAHGRPRATGDLDLLVRATPANARRVWAALQTFGAPLDDLTLDDLTSSDLVYQIGVAPTRIDLLTGLTGVGFDEAWVGEHHSAGYEIIASPEVFIGIAAERTKHIKLGTGVGQSGTPLGRVSPVLANKANKNVTCTSPAACANDVNHAIPIPYAIHIRYSPGIRRGCAVYAPDR